MNPLDLISGGCGRTEHVAEAYTAIYSDAETHLVGVYAARFTRTPVPDPPWGSVRFTRGDTVVVVSGDGPCSQAITAYVRELTAR